MSMHDLQFAAYIKTDDVSQTMSVGFSKEFFEESSTPFTLYKQSMEAFYTKALATVLSIEEDKVATELGVKLHHA